MEKLSIHGEVNNDLEPPVGSEPDLENIRSDCRSDVQDSSKGDEGGREEESLEMPNLTPVTISSCELDEDSNYKFKGGILDSKMVDLTGNSRLEVVNTEQNDVENDEDMLVMKDLLDSDANAGEKEEEDTDTDWDRDE